MDLQPDDDCLRLAEAVRTVSFLLYIHDIEHNQQPSPLSYVLEQFARGLDVDDIK
jgi:hypothetical protein